MALLPLLALMMPNLPAAEGTAPVANVLLHDLTGARQALYDVGRGGAGTVVAITDLASPLSRF